MRCTLERRAGTVTSRKLKTPTGPAGVFSVETRRICSSSSNICTGGTDASSRSGVPSARNRRSASRYFLALSLAARFGETAGEPGIPPLLVALCGLVHVPHDHAPALARSFQGRDVHPEFFGLALGRLGGVHLDLRLALRAFRLIRGRFRLRCRDGPLHFDAPLDGLAIKGVLGLGDDGGEDLRFGNRQVGQDLAVKVDLGQLQAVDEPGVGEAVLAGAGVDALDPERPEIPLALLASLVGVDAALPDLLLG